jgi:hypothetical protein
MLHGYTICLKRLLLTAGLTRETAEHLGGFGSKKSTFHKGAARYAAA